MTVRSSAGLSRSTSSSIEPSDRWTATFTAATASSCDWIGIAIERRPEASSSLETAIPRERIRASSEQSAVLLMIVFGPRRTNSIAIERLPPARRVEIREQDLAHRGAVGGQPRADVQVEVDLALALLRGAAALDVDDVDVVEDRHVHGVAGLVAQLLQVRCRDLAQLHRVDRGEAEVEHARPEAVLPRRRVLVEVPELVSVAT